MKKIKLRYVWLSIFLAFAVAVGLIVALTFTKGTLTNVLIVLLAVVFIYMTVAVQYASINTFRYKQKPPKYPQAEFTAQTADLAQLAADLGYEVSKADFGSFNLKIKDQVAYRLVVIKDCDKYFNESPTEPQTKKPNQKLAKCQKFIGFEFFVEPDEQVIAKLPDICIAGEKIFFRAFYLKDGKIICPNYQEPPAEFKAEVEFFTTELKLQRIEKQSQ